MRSTLNDSSQLSSISQKMHLQHCPFLNHFGSQPGIHPGLCNLSCDGSRVSDDPEGLHCPFPSASRVNTSSHASPWLPAFIGAPFEILNNDRIIFHFLRGAHALTNTITAPIGRVKLLMQNQDEMISSGHLSKPYKGIWDCFARTIKKEGIISLWRGNLPETFKLLSKHAIHNASKNFFGGIFDCAEYQEHIWKFHCMKFAEGSVSFGATLLFLCPLKFAQTRLATNIKTESGPGVGKRQFDGMFDLFRKTLKSEGIGGIYRGYNILYLETMLKTYLTVTLHSSLKPGIVLLVRNGFLGYITATAANPVVSNLVAYPLDTIYRRMMMTSGGCAKYKGSVDALKQIVKSARAQSLYKGASAGMLQTVLTISIMAVADLKMVHWTRNNTCTLHWIWINDLFDKE